MSGNHQIVWPKSLHAMRSKALAYTNPPLIQPTIK